MAHAVASGAVGAVDEADLVPLSALQHHLFCPRQCALIHVEREWAEDAATVEGRLLHERADKPGARARGPVRVLTAVPLRSFSLGVSGIADVVEMRVEDGREAPRPVEYKRGRPKSHRADEVQLCAQGMCLEEMLGVPVPEGDLFYGERRRRTTVAFDETLRALTARVAAEVRAMIASGTTPPPDYAPAKCGRCSLIEICRPKEMARPRSASRWLDAAVEG